MEGLEDLGCQGGRGFQRRGKNKPTRQPGTRGHETGRITNGRIHFGDIILLGSPSGEELYA